MRFGISTHLYHDQRLEREHLAQIAALRLRGDRAVRDAQPLRLSRPAARSTQLADWLERHRADAEQRARADHRPSSAAAIGGARRYSNAVGRSRARARRRSGKRRRRCGSPTASRSTCWSCISARRRRRAAAGDNHRGVGAAQPRGDLPGGRAARRPGRGRSDPEPPLGRRGAGRDARAGLRRRGTPASASTSATRT